MTEHRSFEIEGIVFDRVCDVTEEARLDAGKKLLICYPNPHQAAFRIEDGSEHHSQGFNLCDMYRPKTDATTIISLTARRLKKEPVSLKYLLRRFQPPAAHQ